MANITQEPREAAGTITVAAHRVGDHSQTGEVLEILGEPDRPHYRVRWEDGTETIYYPSSDATVRLRPIH